MGFVDAVKLSALKAMLSVKSNPERVRRVIRRAQPARPEDVAVTTAWGRSPAHAEHGTANGSPKDRVRVAAVQTKAELMRSAEDFAEKMFSLAQKAAAGGAELVAFPEDTGILLFGLIPGIEALASSALGHKGGAAETGQAGQAGTSGAQGNSTGAGAARGPAQNAPSVADMLRFLSPAVRRIYETTFSEIARALGVYVVSGSALVAEPGTGNIRNIACLFGPDGGLIGTHMKAHLMPIEAEWQVTPGDELTVHELPVGRLAFPICMDATYFETFRILELEGAELVVIPSANPEPYHMWYAMRGIWPRVQESMVYGIGACLVGEFLGMTFSGRSAILAPLELSPRGDGFLAQARDPYQEEVLVAELDYTRLRELRAESPTDLNFGLISRYLPGLYDGAAARRRGAAQSLPKEVPSA